MSEKFKTPETMEEALERKAALLEQINKYNEEYFSGTTTLSDEEINLLQEEYQFLEDLTISNEEEVVMEEQTEKNFFDKVNIFVWIYALFAFFSSLFFVQNAVGSFVFFDNVLLINDAQWIYGINDFLLLVIILGSYLIYPVLLTILGIILKCTVFKKTLEDKKASRYVYLGQLALLVLNFVITWFLVIEQIYVQLKVL